MVPAERSHLMACSGWIRGPGRMERCTEQSVYMVVTDTGKWDLGKSWETREVCAEHCPAEAPTIQLIELKVPERTT